MPAGPLGKKLDRRQFFWLAMSKGGDIKRVNPVYARFLFVLFQGTSLHINEEKKETIHA
jgi:hypothetical protein